MTPALEVTAACLAFNLLGVTLLRLLARRYR